MKLYILARPENEHPYYDVNNRVCVIAASPAKARKLAAAVAGDEGPAVWLDPKLTTCRVVDIASPGVLCREGCDG